jgi:hypothetical protein
VNAIHIAPSHVGELHHELGIPTGSPIPTARLHAAEAHAGPKEEKRLVFAENARKWNHAHGDHASSAAAHHAFHAR